MRAFLKIVAGLLCVILLAGCAPEAPLTEPTQTADPQQYLSALTDAINAVNASDDRIQTVTLTKTRQIGSQTFTEASTQTVSCQDLTSRAKIFQKEDVSYGGYSVQNTRYFQYQRAYHQVNGRTFSATMTTKAFLDMLIPPVLLDPELYAAVDARYEGDNVRLSFRNASALEGWIGAETAIIPESASAEALLRPNGSLAETAYRVTFQQGNAKVTLEASCQVTLPNALDLSGQLPEPPADTVKLLDLSIPELLLRAAGDLYAANAIHSRSEETIDSQAIKTRRTQQIELWLDSSKDPLQAQIDYTVELSDYAGNTTRSVTAETFRDGRYTTVTDGGEPVTSDSVSAEDMQTYCEDLLLMSMFAISHLENAQVEYSDGLCRIRFTGTEAMTDALCQNIYGLLGVDLDALSSESSGDPVSGYLAVDLLTGLPTAAGMTLGKNHTVNAAPKALTYALHQIYDFDADAN